MAKIAWTKTAPRTYTTTIGNAFVVIKGIDDLFFLYIKRPGQPVVSGGHFGRLGAAKAWVAEKVETVAVARYNFSEDAAQSAIQRTASTGVTHTVREEYGTFVVETVSA